MVKRKSEIYPPIYSFARETYKKKGVSKLKVPFDTLSAFSLVDLLPAFTLICLMVVSGPQNPNGTIYKQHSLIIWPSLHFKRHGNVEETLTSLRDTQGGKLLKSFEIQSREKIK